MATRLRAAAAVRAAALPGAMRPPALLELARARLHCCGDSRGDVGTGRAEPVKPMVALVSGAVAGMSIDLSTRSRRAPFRATPLFSPSKMKGVVCGRSQLQGALRLWRGIGAAIASAVPAAASFFVTYESSSSAPGGVLGDGTAALSCAAALVAEAVSCVVRVPADAQDAAAGDARRYRGRRARSSRRAAGARCTRGWRDAARPAVCAHPVPLGRPQTQPVRRRLAEGACPPPGRGRGLGRPDADRGRDGGRDGGACAALLTTPLDVIRTRHVLSAERRHMLSTVRAVHASDGVRGFFRGLLPRTLYMGAGGVVYLGMYTVCCTHFGRLL